ncbi:MAG: hypothetical protein NT010_00570 [Proteobacteria bacterium]|nr:hypothetical protein [Pseudomonadota bacterium]
MNIVAKNYLVMGQVANVDMIPVGDVEGYSLAIFERRDLGQVDNEVAVVTSWVQGDLIKGSGPMRGYTRYVHEDTSTIISKTQYTSMWSSELKTGLYEESKREFVMDTDRFTGIKGGSFWKGKQVTPISKETRSDWIVQGTMTYTLLSG